MSETATTTSETITIEVPADAPERDLNRVKREAEVARTRAQIVREYRDLLSRHDYREAFEILAERHDESVRSVRMAVWGG